MISQEHVGRTFDPFTITIEPFQLRLFAKATGEDRPEYVDLTRALTLGLRGLVAPPTFLFSIWMQDPVPFRLAAALGLDMARVLHGEQTFTYAEPIYSGDIVTVVETITDIYAKRDGALEFVISEIAATNQFGNQIGAATCATIYRN